MSERVLNMLLFDYYKSKTRQKAARKIPALARVAELVSLPKRYA